VTSSRQTEHSSEPGQKQAVSAEIVYTEPALAWLVLSRQQIEAKTDTCLSNLSDLI
jgi:hypothetical protein